MSGATSSGRTLAAPRSWLFVPGDRPERFDKAAASGTDAVILDLEDAVAAASRDKAGAAVVQWISSRGAGGPQVWVRIASPNDRDGVVAQLLGLSRLDGLVLPKVETVDQVCGWSKPVMAQIESAVGVVNAVAIAAGGDHNLVALTLGTEDLALSLHCQSDAAGMTGPASHLVVASRAADRFVYACPGSIAQFRDLAAWRATLQAGKGLGSDGALCIHPAQVDPVNTVFAPSAEELAHAQAVVAAFDEAMAKGQAAVQLDGQMLDAPVVERARRLVQRATTLASRA